MSIIHKRAREVQRNKAAAIYTTIQDDEPSADPQEDGQIPDVFDWDLGLRRHWPRGRVQDQRRLVLSAAGRPPNN